ncbi:hypothetical protein JXB02_06075 [Candidatus Woesearchaeota archaeon]|nr:hypothetical protein [Candidatus Woesearchaeota archaeon]
MALDTLIMQVAVFIGIMVLSSVPLYLAIRLLGGEATLFRVIVMNIIAGFIAGLLRDALPGFIGAVIAFLGLLFIYKHSFRLGWLRTFVAWLLQFFIAAIIIVLIVMIGVGFLAF